MKIFLMILLSALYSCSSIHPINRKIEENSSTVLKNESTENATLSDILPIEARPKKEETIRIGDKGGEVYDEEQSSSHQRTDTQIKKAKIGLTFGPGLNRAINYIEVLKEIEKNNLKISIINGTEMGGVVAALYAAGNTPEMIEWMFFKYFKDKGNSKIYETEWLDEVDEFFLQKLKGLKIEDLKMKYFVTIYDSKTQKVYYFDKGNLYDLVKISLRTTKNPMKYSNGVTYSGAFEFENYNANILQSFGANFRIAVDSLVNKVSLSAKNNSHISNLLKISTNYQTRKRKYDFIINIPAENMTMDKTDEAELYIDKTNNFLNTQIINLKRKIQQKQDSLNVI